MAKDKKSNRSQPVNGYNKQQGKILIELKKINKSYGFFPIVGRGLLNGITAGIGATIGLALLLFLIAHILSAFSYVPFVNQILTITKLDAIIETKPVQTDNSINITTTPTVK